LPGRCRDNGVTRGCRSEPLRDSVGRSAHNGILTTPQPQPPERNGDTSRDGVFKRLAPPGYDAKAARSTLRRYPRTLGGTLTSAAGAPISITGDDFDKLAASKLGGVWLGHATVLVRVGGMWVLTDPVFSERIGVKLGPLTFGVPRLLPAVDPARLPRADLILISHAHFDHLDRPSLRALADKRTRVLTAAHTKRLIPRGFGTVDELAWDKEIDVGDLRVRSVRPAHWGARAMWDRFRGFNSYLIEHHDTRTLYAGDTANCDHFATVGPVDLSIFGIGAYDPWEHAHATPEQVWRMHLSAGGRFLMPIHHRTFELSDEPLNEPMERLLNAAGEEHHRVIGRELGEIWVRQEGEVPLP